MGVRELSVMRTNVKTRRRADERHDRVVVGEQIGLVHAEFVIEDVEELALDAADVALAEDAGAQCPMDVLQRRIVAILFKGKNEV